jgi:hypothetical protein
MGGKSRALPADSLNKNLLRTQVLTVNVQKSEFIVVKRVSEGWGQALAISVGTNTMRIRGKGETGGNKE